MLAQSWESCPSVICMPCDKTKEQIADIFIPQERVITLVFWRHHWLTGDVPFHLKFVFILFDQMRHWHIVKFDTSERPKITKSLLLLYFVIFRQKKTNAKIPEFVKLKLLKFALRVYYKIIMCCIYCFLLVLHYLSGYAYYVYSFVVLLECLINHFVGAVYFLCLSSLLVICC